MLADIAIAYLDTQLEFVVTALLVSLVSTGAVILILRRAEEVERRPRIAWAGLAALVVGLGVWTTHFVAMLGFRPDMAVGYQIDVTLLSALLGVVCIGGPLAASCMVDRRSIRIGLGALAGLGVGIMHFTGMSALTGCILTQNRLEAGLALGLGATFMAAAFPLSNRAPWGVLKAGAMVVGVCLLHFTAISGVSLEMLPDVIGGVNTIVLSVLVATTSLGLSLVALAAVWTERRVDRERRASTRREALQNAAFATALKHMSNGIVMVDERRRITAINDRMAELFTLAPGDLSEGMRLDDLYRHLGDDDGDGASSITLAMERHLAQIVAGRPHRTEETLEDARIVTINSRPVEPGGAVLTFNDITESRAAEREIAHLAFHDPLTDLPNRRRFREDVRARMAEPGDTGLVLMDLDRFKPVNDAYGHSAGDALLQGVAGRLLAKSEGRGTAYRLGGDEFAFLADPYALPDLGRIAEDMIKALSTPFRVEDQTITIGCSAGLAVGTGRETVSTLLQKADLALYRAKESGRSRVKAYEEGMIEQTRARRQLEVDLRLATQRREFELLYQPLIDLSGDRIKGFEALIRWHHPTRGLISPADFIPLAEESGLIREIGDWVVEEACSQLRTWSDHVFVAVNVSPVQLQSTDFVRFVERTLSAAGVDPKRLEMELTETAMVEGGLQVAQCLRELRALGIRIAMDDFGTGYSSLTLLRDFELDVIKIDRSFVNVDQDDAKANSVVRAISAMARDLSIQTVGEGVETEDQFTWLKSVGCDTAQGYFFSRPVSADQVALLLVSEDAGIEATVAEIVPVLRSA